MVQRPPKRRYLLRAVTASTALVLTLASVFLGPQTVLLHVLPWRFFPNLLARVRPVGRRVVISCPVEQPPAVSALSSDNRFLAAGVPPEDAAGVASLAEEVAAVGEEPMADPLTLLRFYRARHANVQAAALMYRDALAWRSSFAISSLMDAFGTRGEYRDDGARATNASKWTWTVGPCTPASEMADRHAFFGRLPAPDIEEPVLIWRAGAADYEGMVREGIVDLMIQAFMAHLEDTFQAVRASSLQSKKLLRARIVIDCKGFSFENLRYVPILRKIIIMATSYYPEISTSVTVVRAPIFIAKLYGLVRSLLPKMLQDKVCILGANFHKGLQERTGLQRHAWPTFLGGKAQDCVGEVLPVPSNAWRLLRASETRSSWRDPRIRAAPVHREPRLVYA